MFDRSRPEERRECPVLVDRLPVLAFEDLKTKPRQDETQSKLNSVGNAKCSIQRISQAFCFFEQIDLAPGVRVPDFENP